LGVVLQIVVKIVIHHHGGEGKKMETDSEVHLFTLGRRKGEKNQEKKNLRTKKTKCSLFTIRELQKGRGGLKTETGP
jgi:hypothetical protein